MLSQTASPELTEWIVHEVIVPGHYRNHRAKLLAKLQKVGQRALRRLEAIGLGPADDNNHGLFA